MKLPEDCTVLELKGKYLLSFPDTTGVMRSFEINESFAYLVHTFTGEVFTLTDLADALQDHFGIDPIRATADAGAAIRSWRRIRLIQD